MTERVREILSNYGSENPGVLTNLARILNHGTLAGTGKLVILPVDQGFEHGPARSFAPNPPGYDPDYHFQLAIDSGCNAYAAPLGFLEAGAARFAGEIPLILKLNSHEGLHSDKDPISFQTGSVENAGGVLLEQTYRDALEKLGALAVREGGQELLVPGAQGERAAKRAPAYLLGHALVVPARLGPEGHAASHEDRRSVRPVPGASGPLLSVLLALAALDLAPPLCGGGSPPARGALGYHHLVFYWPAPYDEESMVRMANEVRPRLEALIAR